MLTPPWWKGVYLLKHLKLDGAPLPVTARAFSVSIWGDRWNSNPRPPEPQSGALPTELRPHGGAGGIRTLARLLTPSNPLAGGPLEPLGYRSK